MTLWLIVRNRRVWLLLCSDDGFWISELWLWRGLPSLEKLLSSQLNLVARIIVFFIIEWHYFLLVLLEIAARSWEVAPSKSVLSLSFISILIILALISLWLLYEVRLVINYLCSESHARIFHAACSKAVVALSWVSSWLLRIGLLSFLLFSLHFDP